MKSSNPIGIMQGRLSPQCGERIQSFPVDTWRKEFALAKESGLFCIEFIYGVDTATVNPIKTDEGIKEIHRVAADSGVSVSSICADYFMSELLISQDGNLVHSNFMHLKWLLKQARKLKARYVMVPFVDSSRLRTDRQLKGLQNFLKNIGSFIDEIGVEVHMETDLDPQTWAEILESASHPLIRICYDIGDRASLGYDPLIEFNYLSSWLGSVHIKDRLPGGHTVPLGAGGADFKTCFHSFRKVGYQEPFILQVAREDDLSEIELAVRNRKFVEEHIAAAAKSG